jgi:hypothetical protein
MEDPMTRSATVSIRGGLVTDDPACAVPYITFRNADLQFQTTAEDGRRIDGAHFYESYTCVYFQSAEAMREIARHMERVADAVDAAAAARAAANREQEVAA